MKTFLNLIVWAVLVASLVSVVIIVLINHQSKDGGFDISITPAYGEQYQQMNTGYYANAQKRHSYEYYTAWGETEEKALENLWRNIIEVNH